MYDSVCSWSVANTKADVCHRNIVTSNRLRAECCYIVLFKVVKDVQYRRNLFLLDIEERVILRNM